jgi:hypothetical protein
MHDHRVAVDVGHGFAGQSAGGHAGRDHDEHSIVGHETGKSGKRRVQRSAHDCRGDAYDIAPELGKLVVSARFPRLARWAICQLGLNPPRRTR